jgi:hypothetical protein
MSDPSATLRRCLRRVARGAGPWLHDAAAEFTRDGSAVLLAAVVPLPRRAKTAPAEDATPRGRPADVPREVLLWLRANPNRHHADIIDAMTAKGHSRTQTAAALASLVRLGLVEHTARGLPYRAAV